MILYDQFGRETSTTKKPEYRPLAAAPLNHGARDYVSDGLTPVTLASIFREADAGDMRRQAELFEAMSEKDAHLLGETTKRRHAILDVDFRVQPASDDARDVKVAEFVTDYFDNLTDDDEDRVALQHAVGNGHAMMEIDWDVSAGQAMPNRMNWIEPSRLIFTDPAGTLRKYPLLITDDNPMGQDIPPWKTLFHSYGGKTGHPTRSGVFRVCAWMYLFKNYSIKDWLIFCEVYGMPIRLGKYDSGASTEDREALETAVRTIGTDAAGIISKGTEIEFVASDGAKASGDLYQALGAFCNKEMSKALVGQTLTADVGSTGSYAASQTHNDIRLDLAKADTRAIATTRRHQLIRPLVGFNFGWDTAVPFYGPVWEESEDLEAKSKWVKEFVGLAPVPARWLYDEFGVPEPEDGEAVIGGPAAPTATPAETVAAKQTFIAKNTDADAVAVLTAMFERETKNLPGPVVDAIREITAAAGSLDAVRAGLDTLTDSLDLTPATAALQKAMACAELAGRAQVLYEMGNNE